MFKRKFKKDPETICEQITISIYSWQMNALDEMKVKLGLSKNEIIRRALTDFFKKISSSSFLFLFLFTNT